MTNHPEPDHTAGNGAAPGAQAPPPHARIAIVGSGFGGLGMAIRLKQAGIHDFVILERADDVGGCWRDNTYPGIACDVPSHLYSFSFAPNPDWSRTFSPGEEIWTYLRHCSERYGIAPHIRFGHEVLEAAWSEDEQRWHVETSQGPFTADLVVAAMGPLSEPSIPDIPGLDGFEGKIFHSARWDHEHDLGGERVAVIGTGASAIQFVPQIQPRVGELHVFQRNAPWVVPRTDRPVTRLERRLFRVLPIAQLLVRAGIFASREAIFLSFRHPRVMRFAERAAQRHLHHQVSDPVLRAKLTPRYRMGCKRILISNDFYPSLTRSNVEVVTDGIREVRGNAIVTADGAEREVDTIILGTGFHVADASGAEHVRGRDGRTLAEVWHGSPQAYLGTTIAGFPNIFWLVGPNTGLGHNSILYMIEAQIAHIMDCLRAMEAQGAQTVEVRKEVQDAYNVEIQNQMPGTVWTAGGCGSWYLDANGRNSTLWPTFTWRYRQRAKRFEAADYTLRPRETTRPAEPIPA